MADSSTAVSTKIVPVAATATVANPTVVKVTAEAPGRTAAAAAMAPAIATAEVTRSGESRPTVVVTTGVDETAAVGDPTTPEPTPVPEVTAAVTVSPIAPPNAALDVSADDGDTAPDPDIDTDELA